MARLPSFGDVQLRKRAGLVVAYLPGLLFSITVGMVKRIVTNIASTDVSKAKQFYVDILGLDIVMDQGWIATFASRAKMAPQISIATEGGSELLCLTSRSKSTTWKKPSGACSTPV
jgi:hypothetical protein